jgi:hypothetical protein
MLLHDLSKKELITPPTWLPSNTHYLTVMGSQAYGVATDTSDMDVFGVAVPPKEYIFKPDLIQGYDPIGPTFNCWTNNHVEDKSARKKYDFRVFNVTKYFHLMEKNNPDVLDSLFVPRECIIHTTQAWEIIRENRREFLHKGVVKRMRSYAFNQLQKMKNCEKYLKEIWDFEEEWDIPHTTSHEDAKALINARGEIPDGKYMDIWYRGLKKTTRFEQQKQFGFDRKFAYHIFRLIDEAEYILENHDLDLREPSRVAKMKAIRRGDIPKEEIVRMFEIAEHRLDKLKDSSTLRQEPDRVKVRAILMHFLESCYGTIEKAQRGLADVAISEIRGTLEKYGL